MTPTARPASRPEPPSIEGFVDPAMARPDFIAKGQAYLAAAHQWLRDNNPRLAGRQALAKFTAAHDALIAAALKHETIHWRERHPGEAVPQLSLVALGGYGRRALSLLSDIDLLFLMGPECEDLVRPLLHLLTDCKLRMSTVARTIDECLARVGHDLDSTTALLEGRLVAGAEKPAKRLMEQLKKRITGPDRRWFLGAIYQQWRQRREKYEATVYLLEPNLKDGEGGLRDVHSVQWVLDSIAGDSNLAGLTGLAGIDEPTLDRFRRAIDMLYTVRNELHAAAGIKQDRLDFARQPAIARRLGYEAGPLHSAEERFMGDYYRHARVIAGISTRAMRELARTQPWLSRELYGPPRRRKLADGSHIERDVLYLPAEAERQFLNDPRRIMAALEKAAVRGWKLSEPSLDMLGRVCRELGDSFAKDPFNCRKFLQILGSGIALEQTIADMHECGLLEVMIPEFEQVRAMVRIDHYHHYTVDEHMIKSLGVASRLRSGEIGRATPVGRIAGQVGRWDVLCLALLLHDIGKGFGRGHAIRGGQIAQRIGDRLGLPHEDVDTVRFLVMAHLKLSHAAQRRDPSDPNVARQLAAEIGTMDRLKMLFVHTVCDLTAVSPDMYNDWKEQLLLECYMGTAAVLGARTELLELPRPNRDVIRRRALEVLPEQIQAIGPGAPVSRPALEIELDSFLKNATDRYLQAAPPATVARHFLIRRTLEPENVIAWHLVPDGGRGLSELTVCAYDAPGLFHNICGALAAKGLNIWSAQIFSTTGGEALNQFQVTDMENRALPAGFRLERLRKDLNQVLLGEKTIEELIEKHKTRARNIVRANRPTPSMVLFDNDSSKSTTIIEIRTADRIGLLYLITGALLKCRLDVQRAIIATEAYGVVDVFYVTDLEYNKIYNQKTQRQIESAILEAIQSPGIQ
ncbi:MAG: [protein-PII] uridylyltransferase [Candidatus Sumerlaeia bacterium]